MPSITDLALGVSGSGWSDVTLTVTYSAGISPVELFLLQNGLKLEERIQIIGDDPGDSTDVVLHTFQSQVIVVWPGQTKVARSRQIVVARGTLNEDPATSGGGGWGGWNWPVPDPDELLARVEIVYVGLSMGPVRADSPVQTISA